MQETCITLCNVASDKSATTGRNDYNQITNWPLGGQRKKKTIHGKLHDIQPCIKE